MSSVRHTSSLVLFWRLAEMEAVHAQQNEILPVHFFLGLLKAADLDWSSVLGENPNFTSDDIKHIGADAGRLRYCFEQVNMDITRTRRHLRKVLVEERDAPQREETKKLRRSPASREVFAEAEQAAAKRDGMVVPMDLLLAVLRSEESNPSLSQAFTRSGCNAGELIRVAEQSSPDDVVKPVVRRAAPKGFAESIGRDLTDLAKRGKLSAVHGRKDEMLDIARILLQQRKNNVILTGEAGVGKTVIVEGLASRIASKELPPEFHKLRIVEISLARLIAGTVYRGQFEARLDALVKEAEGDPNLVLFIDEIHLLMGAGKGGGEMDAANILKPALARGTIRVIGATTTAEFRRSIEKDPAIERRFQVLKIEEPTRQETLAILGSLKEGLESHHKVKLAESALEAAVDLSIKHLPERRLPDKAIDLLDQACSEARLQTLSGDLHANFRSGLLIDRGAVAACLARKLGVPTEQISEEEKDLLMEAEAILEKRVMGQPQAIKAVSSALRTARTGLKSPHKPVGVFLFAGASGSGKTELAKSIAALLFKDESKLLRFDMSEFMEEHSVSKLIGSPPGYRDHDQGGQLTERIRTSPYSVVLLDEIEKAHPRILDLFLQVFDEGFITDSRGRKCSFKEAVIIMTSNLGAAAPKAEMGFKAATPDGAAQDDSFRQNVMDRAKKHFRPELLNRLTEIVPFLPLSEEAVRGIIDKFINALNQRLSVHRVTVSLDASAYEPLMKKGYSRQFGARAMERTIEEAIARPISEYLLSRKQEEEISFLVREEGGAINLQQKRQKVALPPTAT